MYRNTDIFDKNSCFKTINAVQLIINLFTKLISKKYKNTGKIKYNGKNKKKKKSNGDSPQ